MQTSRTTATRQHRLPPDMTDSPGPKTVEVNSRIGDIPAQGWNALVMKNYPFLNHGFLKALETHQCVGENVGWIPRHLTFSDGGRLLGAMPLYEKNNSWGEFVFDHAWADAYRRYGLRYYPKLVNAIPFTPASGQRILVHDDPENMVSALLVAAVNTLVSDSGYSGMHCLFPSPSDHRKLDRQSAVSRNDCQFHWHNRNYGSFEEFLNTLKSKKRKNIRQERRKVTETGLTIRHLDGASARERDWFEFTRLYHGLYDRKFGMPAFNQSFFMEVTEIMPHQVHLFLADHDRKCVAGALMYCDDDTLYGRHWGCTQYVDSLHFELCYYRGIELCIENGLQRFDPGAQGEHKIARGFIPTRTRSLHWMAPSPFNDAIRQFVGREQHHVNRYIDRVRARSPYHSRIR